MLCPNHGGHWSNHGRSKPNKIPNNDKHVAAKIEEGASTQLKELASEITTQKSEITTQNESNKKF